MKQTIAAVRALFAEAEEATTAFATKSGLGCRVGCGDCCNQNTVETTVTEMLPLAEMLLERGDAPAVFDAARAAAASSCIMYRSDPADRTMGRCSVYNDRPLICRLFGFAAVNAKTGEGRVATCKYQKALMPAAVARAEEMAQAGEAPRFADFALRVSSAAPDTVSNRLPINAALSEAIARVGLAQDLSASASDAHPSLS